MRKLLFAFLLLLLSGSAFAEAINVQNAVPAETVWSFSVTLSNAGDFGNAKIFLDGAQIVKVNGDSGIYFPPNSVDVSKVLSNAIVGNNVYLSMAALGKGEHTIRLEVDGTEEATEDVLFFEVLAADESADLQTKINSLHGSVNSLIEQLNELGERVDASLTAADKQELQSRIDSIVSSLNSLEAELLQSEQSANDRIDLLSQQAEELSQQTFDLNKAITSSGLFALAARPESAFIILIIIVGAAAIVLIVKNREKLHLRKSVYGRPAKEEQAVFSKSEEEITSEVLEEAEAGKRGKWAFGEASEKKKESRFGLGDLIKK